MRIFLKSMDRGVWEAIVNGPYIPKVVVDGKEVEKDFSYWTPKKIGMLNIMLELKILLPSL